LTNPCRVRGLLVAALMTATLASSRARADYPIASHRYLADPGSLVSGGRVYLYNSNDDDNTVDGGYTMKSIVCVSSSDLKNYPYVRVEAETLNAQSGIETEPCSAGGMDVTDLANGDWIKVRGVDFGSAGATGFSASVASTATGGSIELRLGSPTGTLIGTCAVPNTGGAQTWAMTTCPVSGATGVKDLYLRFTGTSSPLFNVDYWQFTGGGSGDGGAGGTGGGNVTGTGSTTGVGGADGTGGAREAGMGGRPVDAGSSGGTSGASGGASGRDAATGSGGMRVAGSGGAPAENGGSAAGCSCAFVHGGHSTMTALGLGALLWLVRRRRRADGPAPKRRSS